jgi:DNA-binding NarL/FixJ family response regulator
MFGPLDGTVKAPPMPIVICRLAGTRQRACARTAAGLHRQVLSRQRFPRVASVAGSAVPNLLLSADRARVLGPFTSRGIHIHGTTVTDPSKRTVSFRETTESGERVLIVDTDGQLSGDTASALLSLGLTVSSIASAGEALDVAYRYRPTVVIVDIDIGGQLAGLRLAEAIRRRWGAAVIVMTPRTDATTIRAIAAAMPTAALYKPFYWRQLELTVRLAIEMRGAARTTTAAEEPASGSDLRRSELEDALRRIAVEVSRAGFAAPLPVVSRHHASMGQLRPREREIVMLVLQHHRLPAIAQLLSIPLPAVRQHLRQVFKQLGVRSQQELLLFFQADAIEGGDATS